MATRNKNDEEFTAPESDEEELSTRKSDDEEWLPSHSSSEEELETRSDSDEEELETRNSSEEQISEPRYQTQHENDELPTRDNSSDNESYYSLDEEILDEWSREELVHEVKKSILRILKILREEQEEEKGMSSFQLEESFSARIHRPGK